MKIEISKKQYETLIKATEAASSVYGILGDEVSEDYKEESKDIDNLQDYILTLAPEFGHEEMIEKFRGETILNEELSDELQEAMDDYDNETFWSELETRLGKRDFSRTVTEKEKIEMVKHYNMYPDRIHDLYDKWNREFEKYGVDRLTVDESIVPLSEEFEDEIEEK